METSTDLLLNMVKNGEKSAITNLGFGLVTKTETRRSKVKKEATEEKQYLGEILDSVTSNIGDSVKGQFRKQIEDNFKTLTQYFK